MLPTDQTKKISVFPFLNYKHNDVSCVGNITENVFLYVNKLKNMHKDIYLLVCLHIHTKVLCTWFSSITLLLTLQMSVCVASLQKVRQRPVINRDEQIFHAVCTLTHKHITAQTHVTFVFTHQTTEVFWPSWFGSVYDLWILWAVCEEWCHCSPGKIHDNAGRNPGMINLNKSTEHTNT